MTKRLLKSITLLNHSSYGHTLVEMLAALMIMGITTIPILTFFNNNYSCYFKEMNKIDVQQTARIGVDIIVTNMRKAKQSSIKVYRNTINSNTICKLELIVEGLPKNKRYTYYMDGTNLLQKEEEQFNSGYWGNEAYNQLTYNIKTFDVKKTDNVIDVTLVANIDGISGYQYKLSGSHRLRL